MIRAAFIILLAVLLPIQSESHLNHWGFYAHRRINHFAVFTLPSELFGFYKSHIDIITENAVNPDKRRYAVKGEAPRHFIDIDHYAKEGENPFDVVPRKWDDAVAKFSEDTLQEYGIVPWHIDLMVYRLTRAFQDEDIPRIIRLSADLGHYIGDAHVPLHTTKNYNGQFTGQYGIHGFWESRLPELYDEEYDFFVGQAEYVDYVQDYVWDIVENSHWAVDSVLRFEAELSEEFPADQKFAFEERGRTITKAYSQDFAQAYHEKLDGMVERQMRKTIHAVGSLWYTAWVNAGQPSLGAPSVSVDEEIEKEREELEKQYRGADKPIGRDFDD